MALKCVSTKGASTCGYTQPVGHSPFTGGMALVKTVVIFVVILFFSTTMFSCRHQIPGISEGGGRPVVSGNCSPDSVYFQQQVLPIFVSNCAMAGCHDNISHKEGLVLTSYTSVMAAGVRPGKASESKVYRVITTTNPEDRMPQPPRSPLTQEQIDIIGTWINQGAKNNSCVSASCDTSNVTYSGSVQPIIANKCQGCHSSSLAEGGYDLSNYAGVKARVDDGRLWGSVNQLPGYSAMPKNGTKLSTCELSVIKKWIDAGAPNN